MPQICAWFSDDIQKRIERMADKEGLSKSKTVVALVEHGLNFVEYERTLGEKNDQLGLALHNLNQLQNEIIPPLKLLIEGHDQTKRGFWARLRQPKNR